MLQKSLKILHFSSFFDQLVKLFKKKLSSVVSLLFSSLLNLSRINKTIPAALSISSTKIRGKSVQGPGWSFDQTYKQTEKQKILCTGFTSRAGTIKCICSTITLDWFGPMVSYIVHLFMTSEIKKVLKHFHQAIYFI